MSLDDLKHQSQIGTIKESSLHASLKDWYARSGDHQEIAVDGYLVDIVQGDLLIEIQTTNFGALKDKLNYLLESHKVLVVYPVAVERWIQRISDKNKPLQRRKSPKKGRVEDVFSELLRIPALANTPNFSLEVVFTREEIIWCNDGQGSWRRGRWSVKDRILLEVLGIERFNSVEDYLRILPADLPASFTNRDLAERLGIRQRLAQQITYCFRRMGLIEVTGKSGRFLLFKIIN